MGFREDREAIAQRAEALERELVELRAALTSSELRRTLAVDELEKRIAELTARESGARRAAEPMARKHAALVGAIAFLLVVGGSVFLWRTRADATRAARFDEMERNRMERRLDTLESDLHDAEVARDRALAELRTSTEEHREELSALRRAADRSYRATGSLAVIRGRVAAVQGYGPASVGSTCVLTLSVDESARCLARLTCGGTAIYPTADAPAELDCLMNDGSRWDPRRAPGPALASATIAGAPAVLVYDRAARTILVHQDEPPLPPWSLTLTTEDAVRTMP